MLKRFNIVLMADTHAGSKLGLRNPDHTIERTLIKIDPETQEMYYVVEEYNPPMEPVQELLWQKYLENVHDFVQIAGDDPVFILHLGEVCEGTYYKNSTMALKKDEQIQMAVANMDPLTQFKNIKMMRILAGDRPHEFDEGSASRMVVARLKKDFPDVRGLAHGLLDVSGFKIDYKHKGAFPGSRKWLEGNVARLDLMDHMIREVFEKGEEPADLLVSAHYHEPIEVPVALRTKTGKRRSTLLIVPCMKFPDGHAKHYAMKQKNAATVGMTMVEVINNKILEVHDRFTTVDTRTREVYNG